MTTRKLHYIDAGDGLMLRVRHDRMVWIVRLAGQSAYEIGDYPETTLDEAREDAETARKLAAVGVNPDACTFEQWDKVWATVHQGSPKRRAHCRVCGAPAPTLQELRKQLAGSPQ
jgi:hypothetical protein